MTRHVDAARRDGVGFVCLARPEKRNAINHALVDQFENAVDGFVDSGIRVAVLSAQPPVFCAGADVTEAFDDPGIPATERLIRRLLTDPLLWIANVTGPVLGAGVAIVAACPVALCDEEVTFSLPELRIGLFPSGVMAYLEPLIGSRHALTLGLSGDTLAASDAVRLGLITEAPRRNTLDDRVTWWTQHLGQHDSIIEPARKAWQSLFTRPHVDNRKTELDQLLEAGRATT